MRIVRAYRQWKFRRFYRKVEQAQAHAQAVIDKYIRENY